MCSRQSVKSAGPDKNSWDDARNTELGSVCLRDKWGRSEVGPISHRVQMAVVCWVGCGRPFKWQQCGGDGRTHGVGVTDLVSIRAGVTGEKLLGY